MPKIAYERKSFTPQTLETIDQAEQIIAQYQAQGFSLTCSVLELWASMLSVKK